MSDGVLLENWHGRPDDLFVLVVGERRFVGRKEPVAVTAGGAPRRCCLVAASMLHGELIRDQVCSTGVIVLHRPLADDEKRAVFARFLANPCHDLYYPYPKIEPGLTERCVPDTFWVPTPERAAELDTGEDMLRARTIPLLKELGFHRGTIFDPGCSTGAFLAELGRAFPGSVTIGQDRSPEMVEHARPRLDVVYLGDAAEPAIPMESADLVVCRMLNMDVLPTIQALQLFPRIASRCRPGAHMLLFGHTPVLVSAEWAMRWGLEVLRRHVDWDEGRAAAQYYVLRRSSHTSGSR